MFTSSVSLKSIRSISCLLRVPVVVLMSSSFSTSSGSSSKNIIFSISRRLHIIFSSIFCTFPQEIVCISFPPVIEALYSFGFEENILHISEERHSLTQLGDRQYTWDLPRRGRPGCSGQERRWSGPAESEKKIQGGSHILKIKTRDASMSICPQISKYEHHLPAHNLSRYLWLSLWFEREEVASPQDWGLRAGQGLQMFLKLTKLALGHFTCPKRVSSDEEVIVRMAWQHLWHLGNSIKS